MELLGSSQSTFSDMVSELGLSSGMRSDAEYTLLAPFNSVFSGESYTPHYTAWTSSLIHSAGGNVDFLKMLHGIHAKS